MTFHGTLAGRPFELPNRDRIVLRDGLLAERHARLRPAAAAACRGDPRPGALAAGWSAILSAKRVRKRISETSPGEKPCHDDPDDLRAVRGHPSAIGSVLVKQSNGDGRDNPLRSLDVSHAAKLASGQRAPTAQLREPRGAIGAGSPYVLCTRSTEDAELRASAPVS